MAIEAMNHFTVLTKDLDATRNFYVGILGLKEGYRPPQIGRASCRERVLVAV